MKNQALLIIDVQKDLVTNQLYQKDLFISNIKRMIDYAKDNHIEIIYIQHQDAEDEVNATLIKGSDAWQIYDEIKPINNEKTFDKSYNSAFKDTGLHAYLQNKNIQQLFITGLQCEYCIDASIKVAFELGYDIIIPEYATTTKDHPMFSAKESYEYYNYYIWKNRYATVKPVDKIIQN